MRATSNAVSPSLLRGELHHPPDRQVQNIKLSEVIHVLNNFAPLQNPGRANGVLVVRINEAALNLPSGHHARSPRLQVQLALSV